MNEENQTPQSPQETSTAKPAAKKILIVDDNPEMLRHAEEILKKARFDVVTLNNPKFAFKVIKGEQPDVIVLDIIMPGVDGYTLCAEIKKAYGEKFPILLCTAQTYEQDLIQNAYKDFGADDYALKPLNAEEFVAKVKALVKKKKKTKDDGHPS